MSCMYKVAFVFGTTPWHTCFGYFTFYASSFFHQQATPNYHVSVTFLNVHPQGNPQLVCSLSSHSTSSPLLELFHKGWTHLTSSQACFSTPYFTYASEITWILFWENKNSQAALQTHGISLHRHMLQKTEFHSGSWFLDLESPESGTLKKLPRCDYGAVT